MINKVDQWNSEGSGWITDRVENFYVNIANYEQLWGSSSIPFYPVVVIFHFIG